MTKELNDLMSQLDTASETPPTTVDLGGIVENIDSTHKKPTTVEITSDTVDIHKYLRRLDDVTEDVLASCKADRMEAQGLINILREQVEVAINTGMKLSTGIVESLVKAIEVKTNINTTAVKMIEANAKTLAATKSSINIQQNTVTSAAGFDSSALEKLLSTPMGENDDV